MFDILGYSRAYTYVFPIVNHFNRITMPKSGRLRYRVGSVPVTFKMQKQFFHNFLCFNKILKDLNRKKCLIESKFLASKFFSLFCNTLLTSPHMNRTPVRGTLTIHKISRTLVMFISFSIITLNIQVACSFKKLVDIKI
jgi:hypothetical protein